MALPSKGSLLEPETIAAIVTAVGLSGVGIVRVSGPNTRSIAEHLLGKVPKVREACYLTFWGKENKDNDEDTDPNTDKVIKKKPIDEGIALFFESPNSFTGEDVLELQGHGGPVVMNRLLREVIARGARLATPGEFSLRAFLNNKIDLFQAEAIADLIHASTEKAADSAIQSLQGEFSTQVEAWVESLIQLRLYVEAAIDFPEEELDFLSADHLKEKLFNLKEAVFSVQKLAKQGALLREGIKVVIAGLPNAGKSSLLNKLSGLDLAIVSETPGTTRDVLREQIALDGLLVRFIDTAGLRKNSEELTLDCVEAEGIRRACQEIKEADHLLWIYDGGSQDFASGFKLGDLDPHFLQWKAEFPTHSSFTLVCNKIDALGLPSKIDQSGQFAFGDQSANADQFAHIYLSAKTGEGLEILKNHLKSVVGFCENSTEGVFTARRRHLEALKKASDHIEAGINALLVLKAGELLAEELRQAQLALETITGQFTSDDLLGRIFSEFCIGK